MTRVILFLSLMSLAACAGGGGMFGGGRDEPEMQIETPPAGGTTDASEGLDATGDDTTEAASAPPGEGRFLGFSVTSLGDATQSGLWLETPLVTAEEPGRVVAENGRTLVVTLRPSGGAQGSGSRLSLAGFQALGLDLTSLPTLTVISDA